MLAGFGAAAVGSLSPNHACKMARTVGTCSKSNRLNLRIASCPRATTLIQSHRYTTFGPDDVTCARRKHPQHHAGSFSYLWCASHDATMQCITISLSVNIPDVMNRMTCPLSAAKSAKQCPYRVHGGHSHVHPQHLEHIPTMPFISEKMKHN